MSVPTTELVPADLDPRLAEVERQVADARVRATSIEVANDNQAEKAAQILREIAAHRKAAEAERKELVGPLNDTVKRINRRFKDSLAPLDAADKIVRERLGTYQAEEERRRIEAQRKLDEERERVEREAREKREAAERAEREAIELAAEADGAGDAEVAAELAVEARRDAERADVTERAIQSLPAQASPEAPKPDGIATTKRWDFTVTDPSLVPERFKVVDEVALRKYMREVLKETDAPPEVPGVEFAQVSGMAVRS